MYEVLWLSSPKQQILKRSQLSLKTRLNFQLCQWNRPIDVNTWFRHVNLRNPIKRPTEPPNPGFLALPSSWGGSPADKQAALDFLAAKNQPQRQKPRHPGWSTS